MELEQWPALRALVVHTAEHLTPCRADPTPYLEPEQVDAATRREAIEACGHCPALELCRAACEEVPPAGVLQAGRSWSVTHRKAPKPLPAPRAPRQLRGPRISPADRAAAALAEAGPMTIQELAGATGFRPNSLRPALRADPTRFAAVVGTRPAGGLPANVWALVDADERPAD